MTSAAPSTGRKLWELLSPTQRRTIVALFAMMLVGMLLETAGIGLVIPALAFLTQGDAVRRSDTFVKLVRFLGDPTQTQLVVGGMLFLVALHTVRVLFMGFLTWRQSRFTFQLQAMFSQRLFAAYLRQPYTFHLQRNSAQLIRDSTTQVGEITSVVQQSLLMATEGLVLVGTGALLFVVEPVGALVVAVTFALASWVFSRITRARLVRWGATRQVHDMLRLQHLQQGLGGAKDIRLLGREADFLKQYATHSDGASRIGEWLATLQAIPRLWLELLAVVELAVLVMVMIAWGRPLASLTPTLGLFAAAAFRLMPSVSRILSTIQTVRSADSVIENVHREITTLERAPVLVRTQLMGFQKSITLEGVGFSYPETAARAVRDVSLDVARGTTVGIIGGSGAGKSTLVDIILGLLTPDTGAVRVDGVDTRANMRGWQDQIGYVPQTIYLTDDSLRRNVAFGIPAEAIDEAAVMRALRAAQLEEFVRELPNGLDTVVGERGVRLSGGQRQRIGIARALYHDPQILVLDEATSSVDTATERGIMDSVKALHGTKTIIIVAHRLSTVEDCDKLFRLDKGVVVKEGSSAELLGSGAGGAR